MTNPVELIRTKVKRAYEHIDQLDVACKAFKNTGPYVARTKRDPQTRKLHYYAAKVDPVPVQVVLLLGDAIHNLRSALDHLAYQLVFVGTNGAGNADRPNDPFRHVEFPVADSLAEFVSPRIQRKIEGATQAAKDAIANTKPYKGGNDTLWELHRLNNIDKHRLLISGGGRFSDVDIGPIGWKLLADAMRARSPERAAQVERTSLAIPIRPADDLFPLKIGDDLFIDAPDAEPNEKVKFTIEIAFGEPGIIKPRSIFPTIKQMADLVDSLILSFEPFL
jgi:hypothetical protein